MTALIAFFFFFLMAVWRPNFFLLLYIIVQSQFGGLLDFDVLVTIGGFAVGHAVLNAACAAGSLFWIRVVDRRLLGFLFLLLGFGFYGYLRATHVDPGVGIRALVEGKHFLSIALLMYLAAASRALDPNYVERVIICLGLYLSCVEVIYLVSGISPPVYLTENYQGTYQRVAHPTYVALAFFVTLYRSDVFRACGVLVKLTLVLGMSLAGHSALLLSTLAATTFYFSFIALSTVRIRSSLTVLVTSVVLAASLIITFQLQNLLLIYEAVFGSSLAVSGSVLGRLAQNSHRWELLWEAPVLGYGFFHSSSGVLGGPFGISENRFMSGFSVVDAGYLNLFLYFGVPGGIAFALVWVFKMLGDVARSRYDGPAYFNYLFLIVMLATNVTWAPLSYSFGLVPLFIAAWISGKQAQVGARSGTE